MRRCLLFLVSLALVLVSSGCHRGIAGSRPAETVTPPGATAGGQAGQTAGARGPRSLVCTFQDGQGRTIKLSYGKGRGHRGDWGWAHIVDKHIRGHWEDGGVVTTFPQAFGTRSEEEVQNLIRQALQQRPHMSHGRPLYDWKPRQGSYRVTVVVGEDQETIITAYPQR
jgi:hypothetical protein